MSHEPIKIIVTTPDALRRILREELAAALAKAIPREAPGEIMTSEEAAQLIKIHPVSIPKLVRDEGLPELRRIGTHRRFRRSEVIEWLQNRGGRGTAPER